MASRPPAKESKELRRIKGKTTAAQVATSTEGFSGQRNPFYWAPFVVVESGL